MGRTTDPYNINFYEGLVRSTAAMYAPHVETEFDDICQRLRIKIWKALAAYQVGKSRLPVERYVFMCMKNECKDIVKKVRRGDVYIEDQRFDGESLDGFEGRYLAAEHEDIFGLVDEGKPLVPSTLTSIERRVIVLLYRDYTHREIAQRLDISRSRMERTVRSIKAKMADWSPGDARAAVLAA